MSSQTNAPHRDNLLGICHGLGETFGFNPLILRLILMFAIMLRPAETVTAYLVGGLALLIAKLATRPTRMNAQKRMLIDA